MKRILLSLITLLFLATYANGGSVFPSTSGGANLASPGPIGGTASSTGQFTQLCVGTSPCTLPGTTGAETASSIGLGVSAPSAGVLETLNQIKSDGFGFWALGGGVIQSTGGAVPTCSASTGTCVTTTGSTNNRGQIHLTGGTAVTSITLTFSAAGSFNQAPFCTVGSGTAAVAGLASPTGACASTAACVFAVSSTTAADVNYTCM